METLRSFLSTAQYAQDDRVPVAFFSLPVPADRGTSTTWGLLDTDLWFWLLAFVFMMMQSVINVTIAVMVYFTIVKQQGTPQSYLFGYGVFCPLLLYLPLVIVRTFEMSNMAHLCCFALTSPALLTFRCLEAMHGVLPSFVFDNNKAAGQPSLSKFVTYYAASIQFRFDPKTEDVLPLTKREMAQKVAHFGRVFMETSALYSLLIPVNYQLFPPVRKEILSVADLFHWKNIVNNFFMAYLTGACLEAGATGMGLLTSAVSGISTSGFNDEPFLRSSSPSDFWGRRWNILVGSGLRRGVFRPLRKGGCSRAFAAMITFLVSGLLHEYILYAMTLRAGVPNNPMQKPFVPSYGRQLLFFIWNGIVLLIERLLEGTAPVRWMQQNVPKPVRTALVLLTVLPVGHLFTDEYIRSCFYSDISLGFPRIVRVE